MRYFLVNLAIHSVILGALIMMVLITASRNKKRKTKSVVFYFLPLAFAVLAIVDLVMITGPRLMDISNIASRSYYYDTGVITEVSFMKNYFIVDGKSVIHTVYAKSFLLSMKYDIAGDLFRKQ